LLAHTKPKARQNLEAKEILVKKYCIWPNSPSCVKKAKFSAIQKLGKYSPHQPFEENCLKISVI
jgi:hypothetical protein